MNKPLVSVVVITYNHEPYIKECLDGIISQKTDFPIEILVNDDCSTDNTANIIKEYENKYPMFFRCIYQSENQYSKNVNPWSDILFPIAKGRYIALCEGDDYWVDPYKLQTQVDFMEKHPDYGFIGTKCKIRKANKLSNESITYLKEPLMVDGNYELYGNVFRKYAKFGPPTRTVSLLFRTSLLDNERPTGDVTLQAILAYKSNFAFINKECCVYRVHDTGVSNAKDDKSKLLYAQWYIDQKLFLNNRFPDECNFDSDELDDILTYLRLRIAIRDFKYSEAIEYKSRIKSNKYKNKFLYKRFSGYISFLLLSIAIKFKIK